ncbi:MAG: hypothetical protein CL928_04740 [Deltaproteobacteria bacterium]|nr:hypothetical protein [Deltaproteobacteria bacterium]
MDEELEEILQEFLAESQEGLEQMANDMLELEKDPDDKEVLGRLFRTLHTIKGTCGFLEFPKLEALSHAGESLLNRMRDGEIRADEVITDALLALSDGIHEFLQEIADTGKEGDGDFPILRERLMALAEGRRELLPGGSEAAASGEQSAVAAPAQPAPSTAAPTAPSTPAPTPSSQPPQTTAATAPEEEEEAQDELAAAAPAPETEEPIRHSFCTFQLAEYMFGVEVERVQEVLHRADITFVPLAPTYVAGVISLRGKIVTAIDTRTLLDLPPTEDQDNAMHLVVNTNQGTLSLIIDRVGEVIEPDLNSFEDLPPNTPRTLCRYVSGVSKLEGQLMLVMETERLVSTF